MDRSCDMNTLICFFFTSLIGVLGENMLTKLHIKYQIRHNLTISHKKWEMYRTCSHRIQCRLQHYKSITHEIIIIKKTLHISLFTSNFLVGFIFKVQPEAGAIIAGDLTALWLTTLHPAAAAEHQSSDPPPCREGVRYAVTHPLKRCSSFIFCPTPSRIKQLSSSDPTWVREKATYGLSTLCTSARMMGGQEWEVDLFSQRHPDKDGD